jgi:hypothetical protein
LRVWLQRTTVGRMQGRSVDGGCAEIPSFFLARWEGQIVSA